MCVCVCTVTDFSAAALPIGVKFCTAVRPHLRQVISYFVGIAPWGMGKFWASRGVIWRGMLLVEAFVVVFSSSRYVLHFLFLGLEERRDFSHWDPPGRKRVFGIF